MICALHGKLTSYKEKEQSKRRKKKLIAKRQRAQKQREGVIGCESLIPRPIQNFYSIPHPNLKLDVFAKSFPTHPDISPQATRISTSSQLGSPPPPPLPFFSNCQNYHPSPKPVSSTPKCLNHFSSRALLKVVSFLIPKPPLAIGIHTLSHPNKCVLEALHKKSFCIFSVLLATLIRMVRRDKKESREAR